MGKENLIPINSRTKEEQRSIATKGGKASGEARRRKKSMKEQLELLMSLPYQNKINPELTKRIKDLKVDTDELNNQMAMNIALYLQALNGNTKAVEIVRDTMGEKPQDNLSVNASVNPFTGLTTEELRKIANGDK